MIPPKDRRRGLAPFLSSPLSRKFALLVIVAGMTMSVAVTSIQAWFDYQDSMAKNRKALAEIESSYGSSLSASLWSYNNVLVQAQLEGITNLPEVEWAEITAEDGTRWTAGEQRSMYKLEQRVPLSFSSGRETPIIGQLTLVVGVDNIYWGLVEYFAVSLLLNFIKTLCISLIVIFLFYRVVGRHLTNLADYLKTLDLSEKAPSFCLRDRQHRSVVDELDLLVTSINDMRANLQSSFDTVKQYKDEIEIALEKERELSSLQRQFVSMVSHEFRTPLAIIDAQAQRLKRRRARITEDKVDELVGKIRSAVSRLTDLMESILSSSRLEDGRIHYEFAPCDIATLLREICGSYRELARKHRIVDDVDGLPSTITADEKLLRQVFSNLLSNAVKYSSEGTTVSLEARSSDTNEIIITVRDQGVGIPEAEVEKLFQRFFRASTSAGIPGTGIGLHLVKQFIEMHGGKINVESEKGVGSTFTVILPAAQPATEQLSTEFDAEDAAIGGRGVAA